MKMRTRTITVTEVMIALCIAVQFFKVPTFAYSVYVIGCLLYTSPSARDGLLSRMPASA